MNNHLTKEKIMKLVYNHLSIEDKRELINHLSGCELCLLKVSFVMAKKRKMCDRVRELSPKYYENSLTESDMKLVQAHIKVCNECNENYKAYINQVEAVDSKVNNYQQKQTNTIPTKELFSKEISSINIIKGDEKASKEDKMAEEKKKPLNPT